jgi:hypothetical protein
MFGFCHLAPHGVRDSFLFERRGAAALVMGKLLGVTLVGMVCAIAIIGGVCPIGIVWIICAIGPLSASIASVTTIPAAEHTSHIPVIVISALDELDSVVRCIETGAED